MFLRLYGNTVHNDADPESFESALEGNRLLQSNLLRDSWITFRVQLV